MKFAILTFLLLPFASPVYAQSDLALIAQTIENYLIGTSQNDPDLIRSAFYEDAQLFLSREGQEIWLMPVHEYAALFDNENRGKPNGRLGRVLSIDQQNDLALAKAEILIPDSGMKFIDVFILKRLSGTWKIISKAATRVDDADQ